MMMVAGSASAVKPKEARKMAVNKRRGRLAYQKVKAVADLVEFKRSMKFS